MGEIYTGKGRKTKGQLKILLRYFDKYNGKWDESQFRELVEKTGYSKRQLNKWFYDRNKKVKESIKAKQISYPGLVFRIMNMKSGRDLTPSFKKLTRGRKIFHIEKVKRNSWPDSGEGRVDPLF
uniref:Homeobox domain-containing protein n=1 Tax=Strombidium rassoulzadegani TaxID=1082188 RepID=A0A7S3CKR3_9SPIT